MNSIKQTRLVKNDNGTASNPRPISPTTVATMNSIVDKPTLLNTLGTKPSKEQKGAYYVEYDLSVYYKVDIKGLTPQGFIAYDVDFWQTKADFDAQKPPVLINTFFLQPTGKTNTNYEALITRTIEDYLVRASLRDETGDQRDLRPVLTQPTDGKSVFNDLGVAAMRDRKVEKT